MFQIRGKLKNPFKWLSQAKVARMHPGSTSLCRNSPERVFAIWFSVALGGPTPKINEGKAGKIGFGCFFGGLRELSYSCFARRHGSCRMG
jgi:hypothetical protein